MADKVVRFRNLATPKQPGELYRLRVLAGPDFGTLFVITGNPLTIGRGVENDIVLNDIKASRKHAEIIFQNGEYSVRDNGSTHGIAVNGNVVKFALLKTSDKIAMGESLVEFVSAEMGNTKVIQMPPKSVPAAATGSSGYTKFIPRPGAVLAKTPSSSAGTFLERNKKLIFLFGGLMLVATLLPNVEEKQRLKKSAKYDEPKDFSADRSISSIQPPKVDEASERNAENYFKEGFREYRARNYLRARIAFETALQLSPGHPMAALYLETTKKTMEKEAQLFFDTAAKHIEASRFEEARQNFEAVRRMYIREQANPIFKEAEKQLAELDKQLEKTK